MNEDGKLALPALPAASTKGRAGRQQVVAARSLPTAEIAAANVPLEVCFVVVLIVSVLIRILGVVTHNPRVAPFQKKRHGYSDEDEWPNQNAVDVNHRRV